MISAEGISMPETVAVSSPAAPLFLKPLLGRVEAGM
jgi:hypothetical protein